MLKEGVAIVRPSFGMIILLLLRKEFCFVMILYQFGSLCFIWGLLVCTL